MLCKSAANFSCLKERRGSTRHPLFWQEKYHAQENEWKDKEKIWYFTQVTHRLQPSLSFLSEITDVALLHALTRFSEREEERKANHKEVLDIEKTKMACAYRTTQTSSRKPAV